MEQKTDPKKIRLYRCMNKKCAPKPGRLGLDFVDNSPEPKCPKCGATADQPKKPIHRLALIHFDPPIDEDEEEYHNHRACDPSTVITSKRRKDGEPDTYHGGSGSVLAVNCPACKETQAFKDAVEASRM